MTQDIEAPDEGNPAYWVKSVEKTFSILQAFSRDEPRLTITRAAAKAELSRAAARRFLLTLVDLGYVRMEGSYFELTPRCLDIGASFLANLSLPQIAEPHLKELAVDLNETASLCVLDGADVVYLARVAAPRLLSVSVNVGTRFPAWATSMGRVLLAGLPAAERRARLARSALVARTGRTLTDVDALMDVLEQVRRDGHALVHGELEEGLVSMAAPIVNRAGRVVAAINVSAQDQRMPPEDMRKRLLPRLLEAAASINTLMRMQD